MKNPKGFVLKKAKINPTGRLATGYSTTDSVFDNETGKAGVHDDLREAFDKMKYALIASHRLNWPDVVFPSKQTNLLHTPEEVAAIKALKKLLNEARAVINEAVQITGFALSGEGATAGVVITGKLTQNGKTIGISSHHFRFNEETFGFEEQLALDIDAATHEVQAYLFSSKHGDLVQADKAQTALDLDVDENTVDVEETTAKGKRGRK